MPRSPDDDVPRRMSISDTQLSADQQQGAINDRTTLRGGVCTGNPTRRRELTATTVGTHLRVAEGGTRAGRERVSGLTKAAEARPSGDRRPREHDARSARRRCAGRLHPSRPRRGARERPSVDRDARRHCSSPTTGLASTDYGHSAVPPDGAAPAIPPWCTP